MTITATFALCNPARPASAKASAKQEAPGQALRQLRQYIKESKLQPGMRLPSERKLAETLSISRPALREAIQALAVLEVLASRRGDGTYLKSLANLEGGWPVSPRLDEMDLDLIELLEVRKMIEPRAAALAAARATEQDLRALKQHLQEMDANIKNVAVREHQDFLFHDAVIRAAGNRVLRRLADSLTPILVKSRKFTGPAHVDLQRLVNQHRSIYEGIRIGDAELAEEAMRQHLLGVGEDLMSRSTR